MLKARCQRLPGKTRHYQGTIQNGRLVQPIPIEDPDYVQIEEGDNGYYLFRYSAMDICLSDSWFETLDQAKQQAEFEFAIEPHQWE